MMPQAAKKEFIVEFQPLPKRIVAVLADRWLFVNDEQVDKQNEAVLWARKMVAAGKTHEIMWLT
jgi:hypothetical protein